MEDYAYQVVKLTEQFYKDFPPDRYPELLIKQARKYNCLLVQTHYGYYICVPFRSNITHKYAFHFRNSKRASRSASGLDYSKIVIIQGQDPNSYLDNKTSLVDADEYSEMRRHIEYIINEVIGYIDDYVEYHFTDGATLTKQEYKRRYSRSSLQYFHSELGI